MVQRSILFLVYGIMLDQNFEKEDTESLLGLTACTV